MEDGPRQITFAAPTSPSFPNSIPNGKNFDGMSEEFYEDSTLVIALWLLEPEH
jgi:hypothetical protein